MEFLEILELTGSVGFTIALIPQFIRTIRLGRAKDVDVAFLVLVWGSSLIMLVYAMQTEQYWVAMSFGANLLVWGTVLFYRLRPRVGPG